MGKTAGRGHKGQRSRSGFSAKLGFEGGQTPLCRRIPKFGFKSFRKKFRCSVEYAKISNWRIRNQRILWEVMKALRMVNLNTRVAKIFNYKLTDGDK